MDPIWLKPHVLEGILPAEIATELAAMPSLASAKVGAPVGLAIEARRIPNILTSPTAILRKDAHPGTLSQQSPTELVNALQGHPGDASLWAAQRLLSASLCASFLVLEDIRRDGAHGQTCLEWGVDDYVTHDPREVFVLRHAIMIIDAWPPIDPENTPLRRARRSSLALFRPSNNHERLAFDAELPLLQEIYCNAVLGQGAGSFKIYTDPLAA